MKIITRDFYLRDTVCVAKLLIGKVIYRTINTYALSGRIVETEAYCFTNDKASHAYRGKTTRNEAMFGPVGCAYVYFIYGNHFCFNITAKANNIAAGAVLIRAIEPLEGIVQMQKKRNRTDPNTLTNGPGKLTQALSISKKDNGIDLTKSGRLYIGEGKSISADCIVATPRIGISVAQDKLWRFCLQGSTFLSK